MSGPGREDRPWGEHPLDEGDGLRLTAGPLHLHLRVEAGELRLAREREGDEADELKWSRWAGGGGAGRITLQPVLPDRPVVVEPEAPFWLLRGAEARIYVRVPVVVQVDVGGDPPTTLTHVPTIELSDTWWGTTEEGELCYWLPTTARRTMEARLFEHHLAVCPLRLVNRSSEELMVDKVALRTAYLSLYDHADTGIWADETRVRYQGDAEGSQLEVAGRPPAEAEGARLLTAPRERLARGFRAKTFARLRSLSGWL